MSASNQILSNRGNPSQINIAPKPYVLQARNIQRRQSPAAELLQENNSLLSSRINASLITPASNSRIASSSGCRGVKRERVATAISVGKDGENSKREGETNREIMHTESIKARIAGQLGSKPPLAANQGPAKENQSRCQAPLKARKNSNLPEPKSAMLPSSSTGKLIERSRQKVAEKHASREQTLTERENTVVANQQDQLLSMIELTKNNLYKDQKVIRHFMNKHKKTIESLGQKHYEKSFEGRKI